jgi:oligopeptide transport system permease protein
MNDTSTRPDAPDTVEKGESLWVGAWYRLRKNKMALAGGVFILLLAGLSFIGPFFLEGDYYTNTVLEDKLTAPGGEYTLGSDHLGRDQLGRIIKGGQISLLVGLVATFVSLTIGIGYGTISGYFGGKIDSVMMRLVDILYSLPFVIFVILLMVFAKDLGDSIDEWFRARGSEFSISGQWNMLLLFVAIGAVEWLTMARIVRGQVMSLRRQEFIEACISLGLPTRRILFRHMVPNILGPVIVYTTLTIPAVMLLEAFLSFLGLGVQPPTPSWGLLIKDGADRMREAWWMLVFPGALFAITASATR